MWGEDNESQETPEEKLLKSVPKPASWGLFVPDE